MNQINAKELRAIRAEDVPEAYQDIVEALGLEVFLTLTDLCGGLNLYIPKRESLEREGRDQLSRAVVIGGQAVGCITVTRGQDVYCRNGELGYWLGRPFCSRGVMTAAVRQICREAFAAFDLVRIQAEVYAPNKASQVVLEKAGFALEGVRHCGIYKNGQLLDSCLYALLKEEEA